MEVRRAGFLALEKLVFQKTQIEVNVTSALAPAWAGFGANARARGGWASILIQTRGLRKPENCGTVGLSVGMQMHRLKLLWQGNSAGRLRRRINGDVKT